MPIRSASEIDYPPFCVTDNQNRADGFSVELMQAALAAMDREVVFRTGLWTDVREWLARGEVQALPLVGRTPEQEKIFDFTFPYMSLHGAIVVRDGTDDIQDLDDLRGRTVTVMEGDNAEEFLRRRDRGIEIQTTATFEEALKELSHGRCEAVVMQRLVALRLLQETGLDNLRIINRPIEGFRQDFCFAVREGDRKTLALLNEGLALIMADGTYRHLHTKWFASLQLPVGRSIIVGGDHNFPPYEFLDENGLPSGYNVDLTRAIAREMGLDIKIRLGPWTERRDALENGSIDALQGMFYSHQRDQVFDFTTPHMVNHYVGVVRADEKPPPSSPEELAGRRLVVQQADIIHDFVTENDLEDRVAAVDTQEEALKQLARGEHDCALVSRLTAYYWIKQRGWDNLTVGRQPLLSAEYCYAVPDGRKALLASFNEGLNILKESGEYRRIQDKWLGVYKEDAPPGFITIIKYTSVILVPLVLILLAGALWTWSLRRQVAEKTRELSQSENLWRIAGQLASLGVWSVNLPGNRVYWTDEVATIHGAPAGLSLTIEEALAYYRPSLRKRIRKTFLVCAREGTTFDEEVELIRETGEKRWVRAIGTAEQNSAGVTINIKGCLQDITERKQAEEQQERMQLQLLQSQKMESVGRLAGGVAHDYNNMLGVILGYTELALNRINTDDPLHDDLTEIFKAARRSIDITNQLLAFARRQTISPEIIDLNDTVEASLKMLRRLIGEEIELTWLPGTNLWPVCLDPVQIDQILANLLVNARDAIDGIGTITIETGNVIHEATEDAGREMSAPGDYVLLIVSDDGCGMDRETRSHLFEPFFTTKETGEGTGLGLATVYGIVRQNNGFVTVYSEPGDGATFRIYLPRHRGKTGGEEAEKTPPPLPRGRGETVLIVEDEDSILRLARRVLEKTGYTVLEASGPNRALELAAEHSGESARIDLLITDVVMPEMNGRELAEKMQDLYPGLEVLYMSGYTADVIARRGVLGSGVNFIQKPFTNQNLAVKVRQVLDKDSET
ncbi:MAG: transporter substrate-binding domain-containing protein [Desulfosudaceae bacterium]